MIYSKRKKLEIQLHFCNVLSTNVYVFKGTVHCSNPDLYLVPGAGLQSHHTATCGADCATSAVGIVFCLVQLVTIGPFSGGRPSGCH